MFESRSYHRQVLEHLRSKRNRIVHFTEETEYGEALVYQLKRYVEEMLIFHLNWSNTFKSIGETAIFLDLPADRRELESRIKLFEKALKFYG